MAFTMKSIELGCIADALAHKGLLLPTLSDASRPEVGQLAICGAAHDSRAVEPNNIFICKGERFDASYLQRAIEAGAAAYVCSAELASTLAECAPHTPALVVDDIRRAMPVVARMAWGNPDEKLPVIGITGSKGKTTTTYMLRAMIDGNEAGAHAALLGSVEYYDGTCSGFSSNTTPEAPELYHRLANAARNELTMVMEVSSQGLKYGRVDGMQFDIGVLTNLGRDHISPVEHPSLEDYIASKMLLFARSKSAVIEGSLLERSEVARAVSKLELTTFSSHDSSCDIYASNITLHDTGTSFVVHTPSWQERMQVGIPGLFNVDNALCAISVAYKLGITPEQIAGALAQVRVPGRMECIASDTADVMGIIDFAHNGQSFERFFESLREVYPQHYIATVFGCTGVKGLERRTQMPPIAAKYSDICVYTEDDPGTEPIENIIADMIDATLPHTNYHVVLDRKEAVHYAVGKAFESAAGGVPALVCVLGKGEETRMLRARGAEPCEPDYDLVQQAIHHFDTTYKKG